MKEAQPHIMLIEACKKGDNKARHQLYQLYARAMFNVCYRMTGNQADAEDLLQEAFTLAFMKLDTFRFESNFGSWLKRIVVNTCINALKKRRVELAFCDNMSRYDTMEEEETPPEFTVQQVVEAMGQLPEGGRMVFSLYLLEGYDHGEIAQIMGITESTSKSQYLRAKRRVAEILTEQKQTQL